MSFMRTVVEDSWSRLLIKVDGSVSKFISYHPFNNGDVICNIFYPDSDCLTVNGGFNIYLLNGESKVYVPK